MTAINKEILIRLSNIKWLSNIGKIEELDIKIDYEYVENIKKASKTTSQTRWSNITLENRNLIRAYLWKNCNERISEWNSITETSKEYRETYLSNNLRDIKLDDMYKKPIIESIKWDVLSIIIEDYYRECGHGVTFFNELLRVYELGHIPCGWVGKFPKGHLLVY